MHLENWTKPALGVLRHGVPLLLALWCLQATSGLLNGFSLAQVMQQMGDLPIWTWTSAAVLTFLSFLAVGQYDVLARRELDGTPHPKAHVHGMVAVGLSQTLGMGLLTATLARYRLNRADGVVHAGQVTVLVALFFLTGLGIVVLALCAGTGMLLPRGLSVGLLVLALVLIGALVLWRPSLRVGHLCLGVPRLRNIGLAVVWAGLDILAAAAVFFVLLPASAEVSFAAFLPVFCIAFAAGVVSGCPGGVGPFELVLFSLTAAGLPAAVDPAVLIGAIFGFRVIYYLIPAVIASFFVVFVPRRAAMGVSLSVPATARLRAETGVVAQNGGAITALDGGTVALWPAGNTLAALYDPDRAHLPAWLRAFQSAARTSGHFPALYKCSARTAAQARAAGWTVVKVAQDAMVCPAEFTVDTPKRAGLRRKLRKAKAAGVQIVTCRDTRDPALAQLDALWCHENNGARGGTMGQFCPLYLAGQRVFVAYVDRQPVAFISLHTEPHEWALDLIRTHPDAPDGTVYALIAQAIAAAAKAQVPQLSLAAIPQSDLSGLMGRVAARLAGSGLVQFKSAFAPRWVPLYAAAPTRAGLVLSCADILRAVLHPPAVQPDPQHTTAGPIWPAYAQTSKLWSFLPVLSD